MENQKPRKFEDLRVFRNYYTNVAIAKNYTTFLQFMEFNFHMLFKINILVNSATEFVGYNYEICYIDSEPEVCYLYSAPEGEHYESFNGVLAGICHAIANQQNIIDYIADEEDNYFEV